METIVLFLTICYYDPAMQMRGSAAQITAKDRSNEEYKTYSRFDSLAVDVW